MGPPEPGGNRLWVLALSMLGCSYTGRLFSTGILIMTLHASSETRPVIDLGMEVGNVFPLIGLLSKHGKPLGWDAVKIANLQEEMMSGDYADAVRVLDRELGEHIDIIVPKGLEAVLMGDCDR